jgi:glycine oxidase
MRIVIVGGGLVGTCFALEASARGAEVIVVDRTGLHAEASTAGAGILGANAEALTGAHAADEGVAAREALMRWVPELEALTKLSARCARRGTLVSATSDDEFAVYKEWLRAHESQGVALTGTEARELEPSLATPAHGAVLFEDDGSLEPARLGSAVTAAVHSAGIRTCCGVAVAAVLMHSGAVTGVRLDDGTAVDGDAVVIASGAWSAQLLAPLGIADDVLPLRGQLLELRPRSGELRTVLFEDKRYIVPRGDGRYVVGSTMERVGFDRGTTESAYADLMTFASRVVPSFRDAEVLAHWAGLRPFRAGGPRIGATPIAGLFTSFGHGRNGILFCRKSAIDLANAMEL